LSGGSPRGAKESSGIPTEEELLAEEEAEKGLMKQWDEQMSDFFPEKMLTLDVFGKSDEVFYHDVVEG
jgi:hypothetical protein